MEPTKEKTDTISVLRDLEPSIVIASLTALIANEINKVNPEQALWFILSTAVFSLGAIFYYFYHINQQENARIWGSKIHDTMTTTGFTLFLVGIMFIVPTNIGVTMLAVLIILNLPATYEILIKIASKINNFLKKKN